MKKRLAFLLAAAMMVSMAVPAFAADPNGTGSVEITSSKSNPDLPDPTDPSNPWMPTDPADPTNPNNLNQFTNTDLQFETTAYNDALSANIPLVETAESTESNVIRTKAGVLVEDISPATTNGNKWTLKVEIGDFFIDGVTDGTGTRALPGYTMDLTASTVHGLTGADVAYTPATQTAQISKDSGAVTVMTSASAGSPGYWVGTWDAVLNTTNTVVVGNAQAEMTWTVAPGL